MRSMNTLIAGAALSAASAVNAGYRGGNIKGEGTLRAEARVAEMIRANRDRLAKAPTEHHSRQVSRRLSRKGKH